MEESYEDFRRQEKQAKLSGSRNALDDGKSSRPLIFLFAGLGLMIPFIAAVWRGSGTRLTVIVVLLHFTSLLFRLPLMMIGLWFFGAGSSSILSAALRLTAIVEFSYGALSLVIYILALFIESTVWFYFGFSAACIAILFFGWELTSEFFELDGLDPLWCWMWIMAVEGAVLGAIKVLFN